MLHWWALLNEHEKFFYIIAYLSTAILLLQLLLNLIGFAGHDIAVDGHDVGGVDHSSGLGLISARTIVAFFVGFGWAGIALLKQHYSPSTSVISATFIGIGFMLIVFWLMRMLYSLSESGNIDLSKAVGQTGTVYIPIAKNGTGTGQIQVTVQGRLREIPAVTDEKEDLPTGTPIVVVKAIANNTMLVHRLKI